MASSSIQGEASTSQTEEEKVRVHRRTEDNLPIEVLGSVIWLARTAPGYYLRDSQGNFEPVEFIEDYWYWLEEYDEFPDQYYTYPRWRIARHQGNTGFWPLDHPQHPNNRAPTLPIPEFAIGSEPQSAITRTSSQGLSPAAFNTPRARADTLESNNSDEQQDHSSSEESSSDQEEPQDVPVPDPDLQLDTEIVTAGIQHALDIQEREPADPLDPNRPAQFIQVAGSVIQGTEPPPLPPLITSEYNQAIAQAAHVLQNYNLDPQALQVGPPPAPAPPPAPVPPPANPPMANNPLTGNLRGEPPTIFNGDRHASETFLEEFEMFQAINNDHELMINPYKRVILALSYMKVPNILDWKADECKKLNEKVTRAANPILRTEEVLWDEFKANFETAFTNTAKKQIAARD